VAHLSRANLRGASLIFANSWDADLRRADLRLADLRLANLSGAELREANLEKAICDVTNFGGIDLSEARGLETIDHVGPSIVGIDTIFKSKGLIPEVFLRGCGVPEEWIGYIQAMAKKPIDYYTCFISHSAKDQLFCDRLHADLQARGVRCWYFPADARGGRPLEEEIFDRGIRLYGKVVVICSAHSVASEPVQKEIKAAWDKERETNA